MVIHLKTYYMKVLDRVKLRNRHAVVIETARSTMITDRKPTRNEQRCPHISQARTNRSEVAWSLSPPCQWKLDANTDIKKNLCS